MCYKSGMEQWKDVRGYEGLYLISDGGAVRSLSPRNERYRRFTRDDIANMQAMKDKGFSVRGIGREYRVSDVYVSKLLRGDAYIDKGKILKPAKRRDGYLFVCLVKDGAKSQPVIHRLVALAFLEPVEGATQVNHKDGCKTNNSLDNLEFVTPSENALHALYTLGKSKKITCEQARAIKAEKTKGTARKIVAAEHGISIHMVTAIWMGKSWAQA